MLSLPAAIAVEGGTVGPYHKPLPFPLQKKGKEKSLLTVLRFHRGVLTDCLLKAAVMDVSLLKLQSFVVVICAHRSG